MQKVEYHQLATLNEAIKKLACNAANVLTDTRACTCSISDVRLTALAGAGADVLAVVF